MKAADRDAPSSREFVGIARKLARLMRGETRTQIAFLAVGGWDTHVNQSQRLARLLPPVGEGLTALVQELGPLYGETAIAVLSEFGRTVRENGNAGTDRGRGTALWLLGGGIRGGRIYGDWRGLSDSQLVEGRDVPVTTDFRDPLAALLVQHLGVARSHLGHIFPGFSPSGDWQLV